MCRCIEMFKIKIDWYAFAMRCSKLIFKIDWYAAVAMRCLKLIDMPLQWNVQNSKLIDMPLQWDVKTENSKLKIENCKGSGLRIGKFQNWKLSDISYIYISYMPWQSNVQKSKMDWYDQSSKLGRERTEERKRLETIFLDGKEVENFFIFLI